MQQQNYHSSISARIPAQEAFAGIANVAGWWTKSFRGRAMKTGDTFSVQFGETRVAFEITAAIDSERIVWRVTDCYLHWLNNKTEWNDSEIVWEISSENGISQIDMTHAGLIPGIECYDSCKAGWNGYILDSLSSLLNEGIGKPD